MIAEWDRTYLGIWNIQVSLAQYSYSEMWKDSRLSSLNEHGKVVSALSDTSSNAPELPEFHTPQSQAWKKIKRDKFGMNFMRIEENFRWRSLSEHFVTFVLSLIFELKADGNGLEINFLVNVIKYLVESGVFSPTMLRVTERQLKEDRFKAN
ncbi:hypothetical protein EV426DRAFT_703240 [Tirmania nivea]|nr:hypothetical protein EV426DRAFT_703240 [Tirmania nivea]